MEASEIPLTDYLCLSLHLAGRAVDGMYRRLLADLELTYPQYLVMRMLWQQGPVVVKDITAVLDLDYGTLSPLLKRLDAAGLVTRTRHPEDERSVRIALTPAGAALEKRARYVPQAVIDGVGLSDADAETLRTLLARVTASAKAAAQPEAAASASARAG